MKFQRFVILKKFPTNLTDYVKERFKLTDKELGIISFDPLSILNLIHTDENGVVQNNAFNILQKYNDKELKDLIPFIYDPTGTMIITGDIPDDVQFSLPILTPPLVSNTDSILIKESTWLFLPKEFLNETLPFFKEKQTIAPFKKFNSFVDESIKKIIDDERYTRSARVGSESDKNAAHSQNLNISVTWMSKAVEAGFKKANAIGSSILNTEPASLFSQKAIDLTPFVISCSTNVGAIGGGFTLTLAPIVIECVGESWQLKKGTVNFRDKGNEFFQDSYSTTPNSEGEFKREVFAFHHIMQVNDLIAIKFEELEIERDPETGESKRDRNLSQNSGITFYDAIKGTPETPEDPKDPNYKAGDTLDMLGLIDSTTVTENAQTGDATISVKGTDFSKMLHKDGAIFFAGAGDNTVGGASDYNSVWFLNDQAILKKSRAFTRLFTSYRVEGEIQDINLFINKPVRFWLEFIKTKLTTTKITLEDFIKERKQQKLGTDYNYIKGDDIGVWQLIKLIVDPEIEAIEITDSTIAASSGNIMSFIQKVCQPPFIEFFCDTYGDKYYWIARKPPFTNSAFLDPVGVQHISESDLEGYSLSFSDDDIYSWYKLKPILWYQGDSSQSDYNNVSVFFPQFADLYGARAMEVSSPYIDYGLNGVNSGNGLKQAMHDMRWLIETTAHLFATRKGTINITGKRTIKRGMRVYLESTDELFYVDSVQNSYSVGRGSTNRSTVVTVSRGIVLSHADRYFNLIDFKEDIINVDTSKVGYDTVLKRGNPKKVVKKWQVNEENFYFLIQRLQWCNEAPPESSYEATALKEKAVRNHRKRKRNTPNN